MGFRDLLLLGTIASAGLILVGGTLAPSNPPAKLGKASPAQSPSAGSIGVPPVVARVDDFFRKSWSEKGLEPAPPADDLTLMRRLSLSLTGSIPSIEEIRAFENQPAGRSVDAWRDALLLDQRTADYLADRLARAFVGTEDGPFLLFRRRRFTNWLSESLHHNRPYDQLVREMISGRGLWTDHPATNFVTVNFSQETERPDPERLAVRVSRAFLGMRLECAQCHDHPFADWKQADFQSLAAFFGATHSNLLGVHDTTLDYKPEDHASHQARLMDPKVPFLPDILPDRGTPRERLASWVVHPDNPKLAQATVNRLWAILLGQPLHDPVDDLPDESILPEPLRLLADDFISSGYNLRRLIKNITSTEVFRLDSRLPLDDGPTPEHEAAWAAFPITPLRPEQVAGALHQAASLTTIGPNSPWIVRLARFTGRNDFVRRYGDTGEDEFEPLGSTIPQRLLLMNGSLVHEKTKGGLFNASTRIAQLAPSDQHAIELAFLAVLTRRPSSDELNHFLGRLEGTKSDTRAERLTDLYWTLLNSTEFSWNH